MAVPRHDLRGDGLRSEAETLQRRRLDVRAQVGVGASAISVARIPPGLP